MHVFTLTLCWSEVPSFGGVLSSLLKQVAIRMEGIPEEMPQAFHKQEKPIGGREPLPDVLRWCVVAPSQHMMIPLDALGQ